MEAERGSMPASAAQLAAVAVATHKTFTQQPPFLEL